MERRSDLTTCDLFAGAGGLSLGFHMAGYRPLFFNDFNSQAGKSFKTNFAEVPSFVGPVQELPTRKILDEAGLDVGDLDVLIGGPPCQGFSINAPVRSREDPRNHLFLHFVRILEDLSPKLFVMENVPGLVSLDRGETLKSVLAAFKRSGYRVKFKILNAAHYGVPQERWRLVFVGTRLKNVEPSFPKPRHFSTRRPNFAGGNEHTFRAAVNSNRPNGNGTLSLFDLEIGLRPPTTIREAIGDLPPISSGGGTKVMNYTNPPESPYQELMRQGADLVHNHTCANLGQINLERLKHIPPGGSWRDIPFDLLPKGMKRARRSDHTRRYGRLHPEDVSGTVLTKCDPHWGSFFHYEQDRVISAREAARIQSFPDWFIFTGSLTEQYRQIGNAVPPLLARALADHLAELLQVRAEALP